MEHPLVVTATAAAGAAAAVLTILGPALFRFLRELRETLKGTANEQVERALAQRDAMVEGAAHVLSEAEALEARAADLPPEARIVIAGFAARLRAHLHNVQIRAGVQSDLAPIVAQAKAVVRGETPETGVKIPPPAE